MVYFIGEDFSSNMEETKQIQNIITGFPEKEIPNIHIDFIDHKEQRYSTCGDYEMKEDGIHIHVSKTRPHYNFLIAIHELLEWYLVHCDGVEIEKIDEFDKRFEKMRSEYPDIVGDAEPGDNENAPYQHYHKIATRVENWFAQTLGVDWNAYEEEINKLD